MRGKCAHCLFFRDLSNPTVMVLEPGPQDEPYDGNCQRYPPVPIAREVPGGFDVETHFPDVRGDDICGEFREDQDKMQKDDALRDDEETST